MIEPTITIAYSEYQSLLEREDIEPLKRRLDEANKQYFRLGCSCKKAEDRCEVLEAYVPWFWKLWFSFFKKEMNNG